MKSHMERVASNPGQVLDTPSFQVNLTSISPWFELGKQQDAMECYSAMVDQLCEQNPELNPVFKGQHSRSMICGDCNHNSLSSEDFIDISLDINKLEGKYDVEAGLEQFIQPEVIDEYTCEKCKSKNPCPKTMLIRQPPEVLTLRMNRFDPDKNDKKINKLVAYPEVLDISDYMETKPKTPKLYSLYGVLVHRGAFNFSGHYFSFVKMAEHWFRADDRRVRKVDQSTVLKQNGAYALFYREIDSDKASVNVAESEISTKVRKPSVEVVDKNVISKSKKPVKKIDKPSVIAKPAKAKDVNNSVKVGKNVEIQEPIEPVKPVESSVVKSVMAKPAKANDVNKSVKENKNVEIQEPIEPVKPVESSVVKDIVSPLPDLTSENSVQMNQLPRGSVVQGSKVGVLNRSPVKITNIQSVVVKNSTQVNARVVNVVPSFGGASSTYSAPITSLPKCTPHVASVSMAPKPTAFSQPMIFRRNIGCKPCKPVENAHIYGLAGRVNNNGSNGYNHKNAMPNCQFPLQPSLLSHKSSQCISATSDMSSATRMRFAAQKPVVSCPVPVKVAQKRKFGQIDESCNGFGAKRQRIDVIRVPEGMVIQRAVKRRPVYQYVNIPVAKVMRVDNGMFF